MSPDITTEKLQAQDAEGRDFWTDGDYIKSFQTTTTRSLKSDLLM